MKIIINKWLVPKGFSGITLFPFIFITKRELLDNPYFINHEKIHIQQQKELFVIFFYIWYIADFIFKYIKYKNWEKAYKNIIFEKEAYQNENNLQYLNQRKKFSFLKRY